MTTEPRDPFEAGRAAARRGEGAETNPHPEGSEPHARWAEGHAAPSEPDAIGDDLADFA